jgi:hypothetical protein
MAIWEDDNLESRSTLVARELLARAGTDVECVVRREHILDLALQERWLDFADALKAEASAPPPRRTAPAARA